jgi:DNA-binding NarL/FixJ family response regulator
VPDIVLLDVQLPEIDGFAVAVRLSELADPPAVVLVSSRDATTYGSRVAAAGVAGFLDKRALSGPALAALLTCLVGVVAGRLTRCDYLVAHLPTN